MSSPVSPRIFFASFFFAILATGCGKLQSSSKPASHAESKSPALSETSTKEASLGEVQQLNYVFHYRLELESAKSKARYAVLDMVSYYDNMCGTFSNEYSKRGFLQRDCRIHFTELRKPESQKPSAGNPIDGVPLYAYIFHYRLELENAQNKMRSTVPDIESYYDHMCQHYYEDYLKKGFNQLDCRIHRVELRKLN